MKQKIKTSIAYTKNWFVTGTVIPSSRGVELEICKYVPKEENKIVVEFGMGHGNITSEILHNLDPTSKLYSFEVNKKFCDHVRKKINDKRLVIVNDRAENVKQHINEDVHSVISSIPFSFFSKENKIAIIKDTYDLLVYNAHFSQLIYSKLYFRLFKEIFEECFVETIKNTPKAFIHHCKKVNKI